MPFYFKIVNKVAETKVGCLVDSVIHGSIRLEKRSKIMECLCLSGLSSDNLQFHNIGRTPWKFQKFRIQCFLTAFSANVPEPHEE